MNWTEEQYQDYLAKQRVTKPTTRPIKGTKSPAEYNSPTMETPPNSAATVLEFTIPVDPRSKKNSMQILINPKTHRPFVMPSAQYKKWVKDCRIHIPHIEVPIAYPINLKCVYYMKTRRRVDITNLHSAVSDMLVEHKILADDNRDIAATYDGSIVLYDKDNPRTEITITRKTHYAQWSAETKKRG